MVKTIVVGPLDTNCYLYINDNTREGFVVDPGYSAKTIIDTIEATGVKPVAIFLTHGHFDHIMAVAELAEHYGIKVIAGQAERELLKNPEMNLSSRMLRAVSLMADCEVKDAEELQLAGVTVSIIETPGHTAGGICLYLKEEKVLFTGDTLFRGSYGRTDFPTGDYQQLMISIKNKLLVLPEDTVCYSGHGDKTLIAYEKQLY